MEFSSDAETLAAMAVTTRWFPELVRRIEKGVEALGAEIEKEAMVLFQEGTVCPVLFLRGKRGWQLELSLRNALEDFLLLDRDKRPVRLDPRLLDAPSASTSGSARRTGHREAATASYHPSTRRRREGGPRTLTGVERGT